MNNINSLSHTSRNCKYHIVFASEYRRKVFCGEKWREIGEILRRLCVEEGQDCRSRSLCRLCAHAVGNSAKGGGVQIHGVLEREERSDDIRGIPGTEVQI